MQHNVFKFSRWLRTDQFFLSILLFKIYLVILPGAHLLLSGAADSQNHRKTAERGQSYTKERGANLVVSFILIAISFFFQITILWNWVRNHRDGQDPKGSKCLRFSLKGNRATQFDPSVQLAWAGLEGCQWSKQQPQSTGTLDETWEDIYPYIPPPKNGKVFCNLEPKLSYLSYKWELPQSNSNTPKSCIYQGLPSPPTPHSIRCSPLPPSSPFPSKFIWGIFALCTNAHHQTS